MLLDLSFHGIGRAFWSACKVFLWVVCSAALSAGIIAAAQLTHDFGVSHPEYVVYSGALVAVINSAGVFLKKWLTSIAPQGIPETSSSGTGEIA